VLHRPVEITIVSGPSPQYYPNGCFWDQSSRSRSEFLESESERLLFSIAAVQIAKKSTNDRQLSVDIVEKLPNSVTTKFLGIFLGTRRAI